MDSAHSRSTGIGGTGSVTECNRNNAMVPPFGWGTRWRVQRRTRPTRKTHHKWWATKRKTLCEITTPPFGWGTKENADNHALGAAIGVGMINTRERASPMQGGRPRPPRTQQSRGHTRTCASHLLRNLLDSTWCQASPPDTIRTKRRASRETHDATSRVT